MTASRPIRFAAAYLTAFAITHDVAAQEPASDAWKMVPRPATTCYPDDDFAEKLTAAGAAMSAEIERQKAVNDAARERFDNMDMAEKAQRMQAFMMKNPQAAMKMMQAEQAIGASAQSAIPEAAEASKRLEAELERLQAAFRTAAGQAVEPIRAKQGELIAAKTIEVGEAAVPMFTNAADHAQYVQRVAEENAAYEKACAPYFGADGSFHQWVSRYRTEVIDKLIASDESADAALILQMQAMDLPGGGYRSTVPLEQVSTFLNRLRTMWGIRQNRAQPVVQLRK